jgi:outer membrane protein OmpA-like peptidoglycan-associated protein
MKDYKQVVASEKLILPAKAANGNVRSSRVTPARNGLQNKLKINRPGDKQELEANNIANKVAGSGGSLASSPTSSFQEDAGSDSQLVSDVLNSTGRPLQTDTKTYMESRFGHDFSKVRIHDDSKAAQSAQAINAKAYTNRNNIVFNKNTGHNTADGRHLLAHELSHVLQQSSGNAANNLIQRQPLSPDPDVTLPSVDLRESASPLLASSLGSAEISRFKTGRDEIPDTGLETLRYTAKQILFFIQKFPLSTVTVKGNTDRVGTDENNASLGQRRADAVKSFLMKEGVPDVIMETESKGESSPAVPTKDGVAEPANRRVEVRFNVKKSQLTFDSSLKMQSPKKQGQSILLSQPPGINLKIAQEPQPTGPFRETGETEIWKKMEEVQKGIDALNKSITQKPSSVSDFVIDGIMDKAIKPLLRKLPISDKLREKAQELLRDAIESGMEKAVDTAIDALPAGADKEALKKAAKAALKQK